MAWVVDTCVLIDVLEGDSHWGVLSARLLDRLTPQGLVVCPVTYVELSPAFGGSAVRQDFFLRQITVHTDEDWTYEDTLAAHSAWQRYTAARRQGMAAKRPIADIQIGAFAERFAGLVTRNPDDYRGVFPRLAIACPA
jgi:predicted nucleic acid-binding protein